MYQITILYKINVHEYYISKKRGPVEDLPSKNKNSWAPVAHTYNPSYSGGRDQEDHDSKPAPDK
jgi:hypothetical protein